MGNSNTASDQRINGNSIGGRGKRIISLVAVVSYLGAIVFANAIIGKFGAVMLPITAFVLIPFDMTARNVLHELWRGKLLFLKMPSLIFLGAVVSYLFAGVDSKVCVASFIAFACAGMTDAVVYQALFFRKPMVKMNASNLAAALVDSVLFPLIAFGTVTWPIMAAQATMKFAGGFMFSFAGKTIIQKIKQ